VDDDAQPVTRRGPFATNPSVGTRGQQAQLRILDAALELFGEVGYHECAVQRITERSGCSRASFYQYFSSKEDLFRHLAGRVALELRASTEALGAVRADASGVAELRDWFDRYSAIYDASRAVFLTFQTAADNDEMVVTGSERVRDRTFGGIRSKIEGSTLDDERLDAVTHLLYESAARSNRTGELVEPVWPDLVGPRRAVLNRSLAEVFHRVLFGVDPDVNVTPMPDDRPRRVAPATRSKVDEPSPDGNGSLGPTAQRTRRLLLEASHTVFARRGFYAARVDDIVAEADVSHGIFYRYFDSKEEVFRILAERAGRRLAGALEGIDAAVPIDDDVDASLTAWLAAYATSYSEEASFVTTWVDKVSRRKRLASSPAFGLDDIHSSMTRFLEPRGFGDVEVDAVVLLVLLDALTTARPTPTVDTIAWTIEHGLLTAPSAARRGRPTRDPQPRTAIDDTLVR
jgi:AcrR family transcriptional regulator